MQAETSFSLHPDTVQHTDRKMVCIPDVMKLENLQDEGGDGRKQMDVNCHTHLGGGGQDTACYTHNSYVHTLIASSQFLPNNLRSKTRENESVQKSGPCATIDDFSVNF